MNATLQNRSSSGDVRLLNVSGEPSTSRQQQDLAPDDDCDSCLVPLQQQQQPRGALDAADNDGSMATWQQVLEMFQFTSPLDCECDSESISSENFDYYVTRLNEEYDNKLCVDKNVYDGLL